MKTSVLLPWALYATAANAHTIFQRISINGVEQPQLKGVRAPDSNNPITNVNDAGIACNNGITRKDNNIVDIPAGARVGAWWGHVIGGAQVPNDRDHPIAASHKGPVSAYLAKVSNAASTGTSGLQWFKIAHDGMDSQAKWAVDRMISTGGWSYFDMPKCIANGNYLMRVELIALHSAYNQGGAQFYVECAQINVVGGGSNSGSNFVSFPGAHKANDPGITLNIYNNASVPNNNGRPYPIPGPAPIVCGPNDGPPPPQPTPQPTQPPPPQPTPQPTQPPPTQPPPPQPTLPPAPPAPTGGAALYGQCGGIGWSGPTTCAQGSCVALNDFYSQCTP